MYKELIIGVLCILLVMGSFGYILYSSISAQNDMKEFALENNYKYCKRVNIVVNCYRTIDNVLSETHIYNCKEVIKTLGECPY